MSLERESTPSKIDVDNELFSLSPGDCVIIANKGGKAVRFQSFRTRVF
jgi:hypothetical protein